jgi:hypothetical protein
VFPSGDHDGLHGGPGSGHVTVVAPGVGVVLVDGDAEEGEPFGGSPSQGG